MRRMLTETEVEKLDSIKPSEIEKLGAMQDPKTATANYVLTAVAGGKAKYKQSKSGAIISTSQGGEASQFSKAQFTAYLGNPYNRDYFPGYVIAKAEATKYLELGFNSLPYYTKSDNTRVYIAPSDYFIMHGSGWDILFGLKQAAYDKFISDTADDRYAVIITGKYGQIKFDQ